MNDGIDQHVCDAENHLMRRNNSAEIVLKLALQGGGAHGAFTWGVLDRVLQVPGLQISAVSGTSSGAMNAAALVQGWLQVLGPTTANYLGELVHLHPRSLQQSSPLSRSAHSSRCVRCASIIMGGRS